ncbi:hypothetical protein [Actinomycetospora chiangmaiensis]|uniref:hypothetical protein n=1 Tax=Actinomycetospora chiangmaiensis TaxID=402650 RepID=UPI00038185D3|nr:hypothetical protein [Actinomycetospora chiangmaiensis]
MLAGVAQLNLGSGLLRFLGDAGGEARRLVGRCYVVAAGVGLLAGVGFAAGARWWAPGLVGAVGYGPLFALFALAAPVWTLFVMQDYVLTAAHRAVVVPIENLAFALLKVGLLVVAAVVGVEAGIAVSWSVASVVAVVGVGWYLSRVLPRGGEIGPGAQPRAMARYVAFDWVGTACLGAVYSVPPLLVLLRLGADAAATFGICWTIAFSLYLVGQGMGQSFVAHAAASPDQAAPAAREMATKVLTLVVPAAIVLAVAARWVLAVFGDHYARTGGTLLALLAASAVPSTISAAGIALARVRHRRWGQAGIPALAVLVVIPLAWALVGPLGLTGVGVAVLVGQTVVAVVILAVGRRERPAPSPA